ncbi:MAG: hypothetical protein ABIC95_04100 [archaeon]
MRKRGPLCAVILVFVALFASTVMAGPNDKSTTIWYPYAEWSFSNPSWDGNLFDLTIR